MKALTITLAIAGLFLLAVGVGFNAPGCKGSPETPTEVASAGSQDETTRTERWIYPKTVEERMNEIIVPSRTETSTGGRKVWRKVKAVRIMSPFGVSPGETISRQQPMKVTEGVVASANVSEGKVEIGEGGGGTVSTGGFKWGIWDSIWSFIKRVAWWGIFGVVIVLILMAIPQTKWIGQGIMRFFAWLVPMVGGVLEAIRASIFKKTAAQVVEGGEKFKAALAAKASSSLGAGEVKEMFQAAHAGSQDATVKKAVKDITG